MNELQINLLNVLTFIEVITGITALLMYKKFKDSYWIWFIYYLIFIAVCELIGNFVLYDFPNVIKYYYDFFVIPVEFVFLYWLYCYKSIERKKLFWYSCGIYALSIFPFFILNESAVVNSFNYIVGVFLLSIMVILEFNKQMKTDDILRFKENMMFYINTGVGLFYIGTLPFFAFNSLLWKEKEIFYNYHIFFLLTNILMYTLFSIALLWGKPNTY